MSEQVAEQVCHSIPLSLTLVCLWVRGNIFYHKPTLDATGALGVADLVAIDWAMFGSGHVAHELVYFFNTSVDRQRAVDVTPEGALAEVICTLH